MATTSAPDPYTILGVGADADAAAIKKAYRKLVLTCHPDKVTDESLRDKKQEEFHRIQQAYETIGEPDKREKYDAEIKLKKLREERDRAAPRSSSTQARHVNVNIYTARPPPEFRSSSSRHTPSKGSSSSNKPYSSGFSRSWDHGFSDRSRTSEEERRTRRTMSDEKLRRDRDETKRESERERERRRQREEEDERVRRAARKEQEAKDREWRDLKDRERERARRDKARREREEREDRERAAAAAARAERKAKEQLAREREIKRRQEAEDKLRAKAKPYVEQYSEEDDNFRRSRPRKASKKDSPARDKSSSKRSSPLDDEVPDLPTSEKLQSNMAFAASYIKGQMLKGKASPKHADAPFSSAEYPDPREWAPKRRASGDAKHNKAEGIRVDTGASSRDHPEGVTVSPTTQSPPRLHKAYTTNHIPAAEPPSSPPPRATLGRSHTMQADFFSRSNGAERHRPSRGRTSLDEDDYYFMRPKIQKKYTIDRRDGIPRAFEASQNDPYSNGSGAGFSKVKMSQPFGPESLSTSKRYDESDYATSSYNAPLYADYDPKFSQARAFVATHS